MSIGAPSKVSSLRASVASWNTVLTVSRVMAFMSMNAGRHMHGHLDLFWHLADGGTAKAQQTRR
jgi:poly-beta-hydroxyalkanoate depolymerase